MAVVDRREIVDNEQIPISQELFSGSTVESQGKIFVLGKLLKDSGTRAVFIVRDVSNVTRQYALKAERRFRDEDESKLMKEVAVLKLFANDDSETSHFPTLIERGRSDTYYFIVVKLTGPNLTELRAQLPNRIFSMATGLEVCRQVLEVLEAMHNKGFVHRDIRPSNFAISRFSRTVLLAVDLGLARRNITSSGLIIAPRVDVGYKGSILYAPINGHEHKELGAKDDCESWLYLLLDLIVRSGLPWKRCAARDDVARLKREARGTLNELLGGLACARTLEKMLTYIDRLRYEDRIDHGYLQRLIREAARRSRVKLTDPFDWCDERPVSRRVLSTDADTTQRSMTTATTASG